MTILAGVALLAYLLGSLPTGYIAGRLVGVDIRKVGSGNVGATNVTRALGKRFGYPVFLVDFAKGLAAVMLAVIMAKAAQSSAQFVDLCAAIGAICSLMGHSYSIWLGFRGGKGVATLMGALFGINWITALIVCVVWIVVFEATRYVSLASIAAAVALPIALAIMLFLKELPTPIPLYFSFCLGAIVVVRHRSNLSRLAKGTEPRFVRK
ncbi:MAG: acyl-phosphate glycerol 3-phosphate acyltransferase [Verrucomicrobia bacterium]|nr:MAG: acyl-phosphate glycerol 3-phosphate acyltransferase [Verrucomicrobiota bacterium]